MAAVGRSTRAVDCAHTSKDADELNDDRLLLRDDVALDLPRPRALRRDRARRRRLDHPPPDGPRQGLPGLRRIAAREAPAATPGLSAGGAAPLRRASEAAAEPASGPLPGVRRRVGAP